jgi:tetratricopeptide (TPR) repeat protein
MNENYEKAIEVYSEIKTDDAQIDDRLQSLVAECYIKLNNYEKAHALLKELITRQTTDDPAFYISYIRCCIETGRESEASQVLVKAADTFPRNVRILTLLALSYLEKGREDLAIQITDKVIRQINDSIRNGNIDGIQNGEELLRESMNLFEGGDFERTVRYYKKILLLSSNLSVTHFNLALAYFSLGDMEHFNEHYRQISLKEMDDFLEKNNFPQPGKMKHIPPEDLTKEYLSNKNNCN